MRVLPLPFPCRGWGPRGVLGYQHHLPMSPAPFRVAQDSAITPFHTPEMRSCFSPAYFFLFKKKNNKSKTAFCSGLELPCRHRGCGCRGAALLQVAAAPRNPLPCTNPRYGGYPPQLCNPILKIIVACSRFVGGAGLRRAACSLRPRATAPARDATEFETRALPQAPPKAQKPPPQGVSSLACEKLFVTPTIVCVRRFRSAIPRMGSPPRRGTQQWPRGRRSSLWWRGLHRVVCSASDSDSATRRSSCTLVVRSNEHDECGLR